MFKTGLLLLVLSALSACSQQKPATRAKFSFNVGAIVTQGPQPAGVMVYGHNSTKSVKFGQLLTQSSYSLDLENGSWTFYAIGWNGTDPMTGTTRCGKATAVLEGKPVDVSLVMTAANCNNATFSDTDYFVTDNIQLLRVYSCADLTGLTAADDCSATVGGHGSVEVRLLNYDSSGVLSTTPLKSNCATVSGATGLASTLVRIPTGGSDFSLITEIHAYESGTCSGASKNIYRFRNGLSQGVESGQVALYDFASAPDETKLFILSDLPVSVPTGLSMSSASPAITSSGTVTVSGVSSGANVNVFTDATCTTQVGTVVAGGSTANVSIFLPGQASYSLYANQVIGGTPSACSTASVNHIVDTTPPTAPSTPTWSGAAISYLTSQTINWTLGTDALSGVASHTLRIYNNVGCSTSAGADVTYTNATTTHTYSGLSDGDLFVQIEIADNAGNTTLSACSAVKSIDTIAPSPATGLGWTESSPTNSNPNINGNWVQSASPDLSNQLFTIYSTSNCSAAPIGTPGFGTGINTALWAAVTEGTYSFKIVSIDLAGNQTDSACSSDLIVDRTAAPPAAVTLTVPVSSPANDNTPEFIVSGVEIGSSVSLFSGPGCVNMVGSIIALGTTANINSTPLGADASYTFSAYQIDLAGNASACTNAGAAYVLDTTPPSVPVVLGIDSNGTDLLIDSMLNDGTYAQVNWTDLPDEYEYTVGIYDAANSANVCPDEVVAADITVFDFSSCVLGANTYTVRLLATDEAGNSSAFSTFKFSTAWSTFGGSPPSDRQGHSAVWTGTQMVIWGGNDGAYLNTGSRYDPATDSWAATTATGAPAARANHTAVWTGIYMVVWGGATGPTTAVNTGGRYDPIGNIWTTMGGTPPTNRQNHLAAWDSAFNRMIVWGGDNAMGTHFSNGAIYNPGPNTWSALSATNAPTSRSSPAYGIAGDYLVVWGGYDNISALGTGARYHLMSNTWSAITMTGAPTARQDMAFAATGSELIIWGGKDGGSIHNDGYRYNPTTDTWTAINSTNSPGDSYGGTLSFNGGNILFFGGKNGSNMVTNNAKLYNPTNDSWHDVTNSLIISPRWKHTAISTGTSHLIFGGIDDVPLEVNSHGKLGP